LRGTCEEVGACGSPFQIACVGNASCGGGVCCGSVQLPAGFDASAFADASFDAAAFDASAFDASGFGFALSCETSCSPMEFQLCTTSNDCKGGLVCAGGPMGGMPAFELIMACVPPPDGGVESLDAGADGASGGDGGDAGAASDALTAADGADGG
jgi:hypothetical protein